ncbi:CHASE3 domain-containing protein [Undibacterium sp. RTI2.1]|uniref:sensor histidine kinase n=1 Tax=unclassified Undibacterium TaxID=2630295 RepID=UPI002B2364D5|nr:MULTISPECIES: CHASE3 domain-containing protein [unclassified Undibacterium]MEB0033046.1 CHASE3 domain-containing protein [Undibacterium sp. RTI2.1]MEB0118894.1 CHASE3 domain-containing protein [Undibacterium sp. RTI2.2]
MSFLGILYWNLEKVAELASSAKHTAIIERELRGLNEDMLNAETGQRGYLLTIDDNYLKPYRVGINNISERLRRLHVLLENSETHSNLERMEPLIHAKLVELAKTIALSKQGQHQDALTLVRGNSGKQFMDEFRQISDETINLELRLFNSVQIRFLDEFQKIFIVVILTGVASIVLLFVTARRMVQRLGQPVAELVKGIEAMAQGDLGLRVRVATDDEIGRICNAFNYMSDHLSTSLKARTAVQKELERSNADLDSFAYVASHDLKAPLRGIRNLVEWIAQDIQSTATEDSLDNLRLLRTRVERLDSLLESLLTYSRVGRKIEDVENVDTGKLVKDINDYLALPEGFNIICSGRMPCLFTPKAPFELVIRNLINNAIKHHDLAEGQVVISAMEQDECIEFRIEDNGPGIATEFHARIFKMFQTLKPRDQIEGSGMGLAIVKKAVEGFGGSIRVESNPPNRGSIFIFTWPRTVV